MRVKVNFGRERTIPLPRVKQAIDHYLKLDAGSRRNLHSDRDEIYIFQPITNYRTLKFDKPLSSRQIHNVVARWGKSAGINKKGQNLSPHYLQRTKESCLAHPDSLTFQKDENTLNSVV